ncbi:MAG: hypothetical protein MJ107_04935 [Lachnospiraceae bacterium]|nr:hypothetical protein [Lachnospiraceae bacterium]
MDKYEYKQRAEEIKKLISLKQFREAQEIADTVDWRNVSDNRMLCTISDLYKKCRRYEDAVDVLLLAYKRNPKVRMTVYSLCELSIKLGNYLDAKEYYNQFCVLAPKEPRKYILLYKLNDALEANIDDRIKILEDYENLECKEKWMYELAYLYHKAGREAECIKECSDIIIYFGEGKYVIKALELKSQHATLSDNEDALYKKLVTPVTAPVEEPIVSVTPDDIEVQPMNVGQFNTIDLQKELANSINEVIFDDSRSKEEDRIPTTVIGEISAPAGEVTQDTIVVVPKKAEEDTVVIPTVAGPVVQVVTKPESISEPTAVSEPTEESATEEITEEANVIEENIGQKTDENVDFKEAEIEGAVLEAGASENALNEEILKNADGAASNNEVSEVKISDPDITEITIDESDKITFSDETVVYSREEIEKALGGSKIIDDPNENGSFADNQAVAVSPLEFKFDSVLSLEGDGQISMVIPEQELIDKQITGQICIDEVMEMYEQQRIAREKRWTEEIEKKVSSDTQELLKDFQEVVDKLDNEIYSAVNNPQTKIPADTVAEEEIIIIEEEDVPGPTDQPTAETSVLETVDNNTEEPVYERDNDPTPQELFFDRTPYVSEKEEVSEEGSLDDGSNLGNLDYLDRFAYAGMQKDLEVRDLEADKVVEDFEQALVDMDSKDVAKTQKAVSELEEIIVDTDEPAEEIVTEDIETVEEEIIVEETEDAESDTIAEENEALEEKTGDIDELTETVNEVLEEDTVSNDSNGPDYGIVGDNTDFITAPEEESDAHESVYINGDFTDEQWAKFESFVQHDIEREQIINALKNMVADSNSGNIIISSADSDSAFELGSQLVSEAMARGFVTAKSGSMRASSLNAKEDPEATIAKVYNGAMIVKEAEELRPETLRAMNTVLSAPEKNMLVILIVSKRQKHKFVEDNKALLDSFTIYIDNEPLDNTELVELAKEYAFNQEYVFDAMGILELHRIIDERQTNSHSVLLKEVKEIVDKAIEHASKKNVGHFFDLLLGKRYDKNDMIILGEKDFIE